MDASNSIALFVSFLAFFVCGVNSVEHVVQPAGVLYQNFEAHDLGVQQNPVEHVAQPAGVLYQNFEAHDLGVQQNPVEHVVQPAGVLYQNFEAHDLGVQQNPVEDKLMHGDSEIAVIDNIVHHSFSESNANTKAGSIQQSNGCVQVPQSLSKTCYKDVMEKKPYTCPKTSLSTKTVCKDVEVHNPSSCTRTVTRQDPYDCSSTTSVNECHDVAKTVVDTCYKDVTKQEPYSCMKHGSQEICRDVVVQAQKLCEKEVMRSEGYECGKKEWQDVCEDREKSSLGKCEKVVMVKESYKCSEGKQKEVCEDVKVDVPDTCMKTTVHKEAYDCSHTEYQCSKTHHAAALHSKDGIHGDGILAIHDVHCVGEHCQARRALSEAMNQSLFSKSLGSSTSTNFHSKGTEKHLLSKHGHVSSISHRTGRKHHRPRGHTMYGMHHHPADASTQHKSGRSVRSRKYKGKSSKKSSGKEYNVSKSPHSHGHGMHSNNGKHNSQTQHRHGHGMYNTKGKHNSHGRHGKKAKVVEHSAEECRKVPVEVSKTCYRSVPTQQSYSCTKAQVKKNCKHILVDVPKMCHREVPSVKSYTCKKKSSKQSCRKKLVDVSRTCHRNVARTETYMCNKDKTEKQCSQQSVKMPSTCHREVISKESYSCPRTTTEKQCKHVPQTIAKTCYKDVQQTESYQCTKLEKQKKCEDVTIPTTSNSTCYKNVKRTEAYSCDETTYTTKCDYHNAKGVIPVVEHHSANHYEQQPTIHSSIADLGGVAPIMKSKGGNVVSSRQIKSSVISRSKHHPISVSSTQSKHVAAAPMVTSGKQHAKKHRHSDRRVRDSHVQYDNHKKASDSTSNNKSGGVVSKGYSQQSSAHLESRNHKRNRPRPPAKKSSHPSDFRARTRHPKHKTQVSSYSNSKSVPHKHEEHYYV